MRVSYLPDRDVLCVSGIPTPFPAQSLQALRQGDTLAVASPHDGMLLCAYTPWTDWTDAGGLAFTSADSAFDYLATTCARRRIDAHIPIVAAIPLGGHRVIRTASDGARYASVDDVDGAGRVLGITIAAADPGAEVRFLMDGDLVEPSWSWSPGPVYCGFNGSLTQSPPVGFWEQQVGTAVSAHRMLVRVDSHILLAERN